jgi:phospholipid/cholesterol/gamma-HCH transport system ATP-binding protein
MTSPGLRTHEPTDASAAGAPEPRADTPVVVFEDVSLAFDEKVVLEQVSFEVLPGRMKVILGASGSGKSTILRLLLGLIRPDAGKIFVFGRRIDTMQEHELMEVRAHLGMVFQEGALFDSLSVRENVGFRLYEHSRTAPEAADQRAAEVLGFVGLAGFGERMPSELSGGERRRVAIARALAANPQILLYDEPTTGLDPITALTIDHEIIKLRDLERATAILVTHQLRDAFYIAMHQVVSTSEELTAGARAVEFGSATPAKLAETEFLMLRGGRIVFRGRVDELQSSTDPYLRAFLNGVAYATTER